MAKRSHQNDTIETKQKDNHRNVTVETKVRCIKKDVPSEFPVFGMFLSLLGLIAREWVKAEREYIYTPSASSLVGELNCP